MILESSVYLSILCFDTEDLFTDVQGSITQFKSYSEKLRDKCDIYKVKILNLAGVVFSD